MIQSLHIFRKDVRHLWPELSIYVALLIAFAWTAPLTWAGASSAQLQVLLQLVLVFVHALLPILWFVMIARLIHDESLVGDQQFWITRPYKWPSLLGAKLLFIVAGVILPFVAMQWFLLLHAGLHPLSAIPGLLLNLLYLTLLCWLPFTVVAAVTSTLPRAAMSMVASVIALIVILVIGGRTAGLRMDPPYLIETLGTIFAVLLVAILLYQYMGRRTTWSRIALIATPVLLIALFAAYPTDLLVRRIYPASSDPAARLTFDSDPDHYESQQGRVVTFGNWTIVNLPAELQGVDPSVRFGDGGLSFTVDAPGYHYVSPWLPSTFHARNVSILFPQEVINRFHGKDVHLHLTFVSERLLAGAAQTAAANTDARFEVPNKGVCSYPADQPGARPFCNYPYQSPPATRVTGPVSALPCEASGPTHPGMGNIRNTAQVPSFDPVVQERLDLGGLNLPGNICNGAQLTFTPYLPTGKLRAELDIPAISLDHYVAHIDLARRSAQGMPPTAPPAPPPATAK